MQNDPQGEREQEEPGGINAEVLRSYLAFVQRAIGQRKLIAAGIFLIGLVSTGLIAKYIPRTYRCLTTLTAVSNSVLDSDRGPLPLAGAENQIMSHDNLETLIKDTNLKKTYAARRPPLLALKDKLIRTLAGPMSDQTMTGVLVGTLENKLSVEVEKDTLSIKVEWSDPATTAEVAEATKNAFLRTRHGAEISAFQDKMAILDKHAGKLREEIDVLADQMKQRIAEKQAELEAEAQSEAKKAGRAVEKRKEPARVVMAPRKPATDEQLPELRQRLATLKQNLAAAESQREGRMRDEQAKLSELQLRFTPNHPQVITQQERVGMASQVPSDLLLMRAEVGDLESQIRQRDAMAKTGGSERIAAVALADGRGELLSNEVLGLLDEKDADPALAAQISGAIVRYGALRDDVRGAKLALDTAQAAFNHRYRVVIPVDEPSQPSKPNVSVIVGVGIFLSLLLGLLLPILLELRRDVVSEAWQVHQLQLPVLANLRLPKNTGD